MRKKIMAFVFAAALLMALAVPLVGGGGTALAVLVPAPNAAPTADAADGLETAAPASASDGAAQTVGDATAIGTPVDVPDNVRQN